MIKVLLYYIIIHSYDISLELHIVKSYSTFDALKAYKRYVLKISDTEPRKLTFSEWDTKNVIHFIVINVFCKI